jgi:uncharacterized protein (DUF58 family)
MPTPRGRAGLKLGSGGLSYLVVAALLIGGAVYTQANLLFWGSGLMLGGIVVSLLMSWQALRGLTLVRLLPAHGVATEPMVIRYRLENRHWLPAFGIIVTERDAAGLAPRPPRRWRFWRRRRPDEGDAPMLAAPPSGWVLHLGPGQVAQAEAIAWPRRRGTMHLARVSVHTGFPFGVVRRTVIFDRPAQVRVLPPLRRVRRRLLHRLTRAEAVGRRHEDRPGGHDEFFGVREHRPGDSHRSIDWKHSAHAGRLIVRERTRPSPPKLVVLLDLRLPTTASAHADAPEYAPRPARGQTPTDPGPSPRPDDAPDAEHSISLAASLICDAYLQGHQLGLVVAGLDVPVFPVHHSLPHRTRMLEMLAGLDLSQRHDRQPQRLPGPVSVCIRPHPGTDDRSAGHRDTVLFGSRIDEYLVGSDSGRLLAPRASSEPRRLQSGKALSPLQKQAAAA